MRRVAITAALLLAAGCTAGTTGGDGGTATLPAPVDGTATPGPSVDASVGPTDESTVTSSLAGPNVELAALIVDDRPSPDRPYSRDEWSHWDDIDGDGCDARQQALKLHSLTPAQIDVYGGCTVVAGDWISIYDGVRTSDPGDLDIDHVVPLANAHEAGGWRFTAEQRRLFANDQGNLLPVSASSNRTKGADLPNEWRPPLESSWCEMATRWVDTKQRWQLTVTTAERDALGQMLERCDGSASAGPVAVPSTVTTLPIGGPAPQQPFANCAEARAAGAAPVHRGDPGYGEHLDRDGDGVGCE